MASTPLAPANAPLRMPPLRALAAFEVAARHGSFTRGAAELSVTLSAVSHQIQQLEEFLGVQLFERRAGRAVLTESGRAYAAQIAPAFATIAEATRSVAPLRQVDHFVVASQYSFATKWLQPRVGDFLQANPGVRLRLSTLADASELRPGDFDIAITYGTPREGQPGEPLFTERLRPLCSPEFARAHALREPRDLARATLIHSSNLVSWAQYFAELGIDVALPRGELWIDRSTMAIEAAVKGLGVVLESALLAGPEVADGRLVCPFAAADCTVERLSYHLVRSSGRRPSRAPAFEQWLRSTLAEESRTAH